MLNAYINGVLSKAEISGQKGKCPFCGTDVVAKCGKFRHAHWAHLSRKDCDSWWESETDWHREWKSRFPQSWQEQTRYDEQTGEKHVADVLTPNGLVIEFQHSSIKPEELQSRNNFYRHILWVVDGCRGKTDFQKMINVFSSRDFKKVDSIPDWPVQRTNFFEFYFADEVFNKTWLKLPIPVFFDFSSHPDLQVLEDSLSIGSLELCCVFPQYSYGAVAAFISKEDFVKSVLASKDFFSPIMKYVNKEWQAEQARIARNNRTYSIRDLMQNPIILRPRYRRRFRF